MQDKKTKLLIANNIDYCVPDVRGGAFATRVYNLVKCNEIEDRLDITVLSLYDEKAEKESKQYTKSKFIYIKVNDKREERFQKSKWIRLLNRISFKVVHTILIPPPKMRAAYKKTKKEKFDYILGAGGDPSNYGWFTRKVGRKRMLFNVGGHLEGGKVAAAAFGNFICCSDYIKNYMHQDVDDCNITTILNRVNIKKFMQELCDEEGVKLKEQLGLLNKVVILFIGRIVAEKGIEELVDAFSEMKYKNNCVLLVAGAANFGYGGRTEFEEKIWRKVESAGENIKLLGFIHHDKLWKYMRISDMAVLPSVWEEPAGNVVPECMAAGLPLIITNSGGMIEYVNEETALVVEKEQGLVKNLRRAMEYLYENPDVRDKMGRAAEEKAKDYDIMIYYDLLYKELCQLQRNGN